MSLEPNLWLDFGAWGAGMMTNAKPPLAIEPSISTITKAVNALHIGTTVALAVFAWKMVEGRIEDNKEKAVTHTKIEMLENRKNPEVLDAVTSTRLDTLEHRVDLISARVDKMVEQQSQHIQHDNDRFQRAK